MNSQSRPEEEKMLEFFVGDWVNSAQVSPGPFGPGGPATGETSYRWDVGGKWLLYVSRLQLPGLGGYEVHGGVAFNRQAGRYDAYAVNSLGNLLVYEGEWSDDVTLVFRLVHPQPHDQAQVVYHKLPDGWFQMTSETASDEGEFVPYFETTAVPKRRPSGDGSSPLG
jgi:hypothetical protein